MVQHQNSTEMIALLNAMQQNQSADVMQKLIRGIIIEALAQLNISCSALEGEDEELSNKIKRSVTIDGEKKWISADTEQEYADKMLSLVNYQRPAETKQDFKEYAMNWFELYSKPNVATVTAKTYERQLTKYLIPAFEGKSIEDITTNDIQCLFNNMSGAKTTKDKAKTVLNMILKSAMDDDIIMKNPLVSSKLRITGEPSKPTEVYSREQMQFLVANIGKISSPMGRAYLALQTLHPLRLEEVLGLKWRDIDLENMVIHVRRAVTHPTRNQPEVKELKTKASERDLGLSKIAAQYLEKGQDDEFVIGGKKPVRYYDVTKMCKNIQNETGFEEKIIPIKFRTTVLTDLYEQTKDIKDAQLAAGHTTSAMTLKYYVKGRGSSDRIAAAIDSAYSS